MHRPDWSVHIPARDARRKPCIHGSSLTAHPLAGYDLAGGYATVLSQIVFVRNVINQSVMLRPVEIAMEMLQCSKARFVRVV